MASTPGSLRTPEIDRALEVNRGRLENLRKVWAERRAGSFNPGLGERCSVEQPALHYLYSAIQGLNPPQLNPPRGLDPRYGIGRDEMAGYAVPTMYVTGEEDVVLPPPVIKAAADATPGARLERVSLAGHSIYFERPEVFNSLLSGFLLDVYPS
jgi:pimeloyl-ACP methyl ester carboxylesterase